MQRNIARGKPADFEQEIVRRRFRLTQERVSIKDKIVLDYGCGNGAQTIKFAKVGCSILAVDINIDGLLSFANYLQSHSIQNINPVLYDSYRLPIASRSIDLVISYDAIEHVQSEMIALKEFHRVLKSGGEIILSVPNKGWIFETHGAYLPLLPWNRVPFFSWLPHSIHRKFAKARIYRKRDIRKLLKDHSFEVIGCDYITAPMDVVKNPHLKKYLRRLIFRDDTTPYTFLATAIIVHARKIG